MSDLDYMDRIGVVRERDILRAQIVRMIEVLKQADLQIEYMQEKFKATGTGNAVRGQIQDAISKAKERLGE